MTPPLLAAPRTDPTPLFEHFRGSYGTELLTAAVAHFHVFSRLAAGPLRFQELRSALVLAERPAVVLVTALRAMGLVVEDKGGRLDLSDLAPTTLSRHLLDNLHSPVAVEEIMNRFTVQALADCISGLVE